MAYQITTWPFPPNWSSAVDEILEWRTAVEISFNETEQRMSLRQNPRRSFEYQIMVRRENAGMLENKLFSWMDKQYAMPIWTEPCTLTAQSNSGGTSLNVSTVDKSFVADGYAILFVSQQQYELVKIDSFDASTITIDDPLTTTWPLGSRLYPVMVSQISADIALGYKTSNVLEASVRFTGMPDVTNTRTAIVAPAVSIGDVELYTMGTNWADGLQHNLQTLGMDEDVESGLFRRRSRSGIAAFMRSYSWLNRDIAKANALRQFFARRQGALVPTWLSSGVDDFQLIASALSSATILQVRNTDYEALVNEHPARRNILIELRSGVNIVREISTYVPSGNVGTLTLGSSIGTAITPTSVKRISFCGLYRMAGDAVTFSWRTNQVSTVQSTFKLLTPS